MWSAHCEIRPGENVTLQYLSHDGRPALAVRTAATMRPAATAMLEKGRDRDMEVRGPVDHGFCRSIYFRDPNGYIVELTADTGVHQEMIDPALSKPHEALARWQMAKSHR